MWTANIKSVNKNELDVDIIVTFTNGVISNDIEYKVSDIDSIKRIIQNQIDQYEKVGGSDIKTGPVDLTPATPREQTDEEKTILEFQLLITQREQTLRAEAMGLPTSPTADELMASIKEKYRPEYLRFLR